MGRVVVLGSSNTDLTVQLPRLPGAGETVLGGEFRRSAGGKGANQAVAACRAGADVVFITAVGDDAYGREALAAYRNEGIDVSWARVVDGSASGIALIFLGEGAENMIGVAPGANGRLTVEDVRDVPISVLTGGGVFLASLEVPLDAVLCGLKRAKDAGMITILNPAPVSTELVERRGEILPLVDIVVPNQSEAQTLAGDATNPAASLAALTGGGRVVITLGKDGCRVVEQGSDTHIAARTVEAIDTVGAGDAFCGALAAALSRGSNLIDAAQWARDAASISVTRQGAQDAMARRDEIDRLASSAN